ncbi:protein ROOT INITIATION DEFECTIVE 3-like [Quillaja saponaria]|uniref:Protein ROOT INITIATION DEFECTIVE 3-like n=1 Tax=Quillaja saponaria TaxID=32244 RepID=A0AAD7PIE6_QUISA|nr:protein ROOT INITIATION DEFECTIVE 3-like [Quillaja saponaria]
MERERQALVVCSDKSMGIGITILDIDTGRSLLHIPTCASPPRGLVCLRNQFLVASQAHKHGSVGGGSIFIWALNKPQPPLRNYPLEAVGPLSCTKDGIYLAGGALSGNAYLWEVTSGKLLRTWRAHDKGLNSVIFSGDDSLLISSSDDGMIRVWSMISLLDVEDSGSLPSLFRYSSEHKSSITGLLTAAGLSGSVLVSSSLDGSCKVWDCVSGRLIQTLVYPLAITAIVLQQGERILFSGSMDGTIFANKIDIELEEGSSVMTMDRPTELKGHNGAITALTFSHSGLISASEDCSICVWDVISRMTIRRFNHHKGAVTNVAVIPQSSLLSASNRKRVSNCFNVCLLDKYPQQASSSSGTITHLSLCQLYKEKQTSSALQLTDSLSRHISDMEKEDMPMAMQMKAETTIENRLWAIEMAKQVMEINKQVQSQLVDLMQCRLLCPPGTDSPATTKRKKLKIENSQEGEQP